MICGCTGLSAVPSPPSAPSCSEAPQRTARPPWGLCRSLPWAGEQPSCARESQPLPFVRPGLLAPFKESRTECGLLTFIFYFFIFLCYCLNGCYYGILYERKTHLLHIRPVCKILKINKERKHLKNFSSNNSRLGKGEK